jgi:hypothetical protein
MMRCVFREESTFISKRLDNHHCDGDNVRKRKETHCSYSDEEG